MGGGTFGGLYFGQYSQGGTPPPDFVFNIVLFTTEAYAAPSVASGAYASPVVASEAYVDGGAESETYIPDS